MRTTALALVCACLILSARSATAQPPIPKPGAEHEKLKAFVGEWDATVAFMGTESKGTASYKLGLGGLWLTLQVKGEFGGQKFEGEGLVGYDPLKKKYVSAWADSMSPVLMTSEGSFSPDGKTFTEIGEGAGMDGKMEKMKSVYQFKDKDTIIVKMFSMPGGKDQEAMTITYKRKK